MTDLTQLLARARAAAESLMVDQVTLQRPGADVYDADTGETTQGAGLTLYAGPARVKPAVSVSRDTQAGERQVVLRGYIVSLPWATVPAGVDRVVPGEGDLIVIEQSADPRLSGMTLWVTSVEGSSTASAWRISAQDRS
jgi:hypothetical protein